ncbi:MAG: phosphatidate cytidylyltransferase [Sphingorhabdus sp.]|uniref:phosphatidate cytidylyltransferase n=1 Tax=Sphingorhabdus sp. TaxID=1902408 RepID=UPI003CBBA516
MSDSTQPGGGLDPGEFRDAKPRRWGDLRNRSVTAFAALLVVGTFIYAGGWWWLTFVVVASLGIFREWLRLIFYRSGTKYAAWLLLGILYIFFCAYLFIDLRHRPNGIITLYSIIAGVIATDTFAYFAGRFIGGKKIAPKISPSKTWSGLLGGCMGAFLATAVALLYVKENHRFFGILDSLNDFNLIQLFFSSFFIGVFLAVIAQSGDFFESWMKRLAGVKDSGRMLPGHGGLFDRVDGLLAVTLIAGGAELLFSGVPGIFF